MVVLGGGVVSYEPGIPVRRMACLHEAFEDATPGPKDTNYLGVPTDKEPPITFGGSYG